MELDYSIKGIRSAVKMGYDKRLLYKTEGSITVFLAFIFVIMLSLVTAIIENVRVTTSNAYVAMAADSAMETVFGGYNKELYDEYGLFGYGGYNGIGVLDFEEELAAIIDINLKYKPEIAYKSYSNLYRLNDVNCEVTDYFTLGESKVFAEQITDFMSASIIDDVKNIVGSQSSKKNSDIQEGIFDEAIKFENGEYDAPDSESGDNGSADKSSKKDIDEQLEDDEARGNPLKAFKNLINNGLLSLVCDASKVSEEKIKIDREFENVVTTELKSDASAFFKVFLEGDESSELSQDKLLGHAEEESGIDKLKYIYYGQKVLSSYIDSEYKTVHYGLEYLVEGKETEKDNLAAIVLKLLILRTLVNFAFVMSDPDFQAKALATASTIGLKIPPAVEAIQRVILAIIAFEEACIDVTALLMGKKVPLIKNKTNCKMTYSKICFVSRDFFEKKAKLYENADNIKISTDVSYEQYLMLFSLLVSKSKLRERILDVIQYDLRERYNQTFNVRECICIADCIVSYNIPYTFSYIKRSIIGKSADRQIELSYGYTDIKHTTT